MRLYIIPILLFLNGCSFFGSCHCTPEIEENKTLITPPELRTSATPVANPTETSLTPIETKADKEGN